MLVLARKRGESVYIGRDIEIVVTEITEHVIRIGVIAPRDVPVVRGEVRERDRRLANVRR